MADLYRKALEGERRKLWAECRLKGLAKDTPQRLRIAEIDKLLKEHSARATERAVSPEDVLKTAIKVQSAPTSPLK